ncbi:MAG: D-alanyl-D-alanine carboxypeptidase family protein, partial [Rhodanobacteraceae bacterium]
KSPAFRWLMRHAKRFGFRLSYPRSNRHGIAYEPWHWCWHPKSRCRVRRSV